MSFVSSLTGSDAAKAAMQAGRIQNQAAQSAAKAFNPYADMGTQNLPALQGLIDNPMGYLQNNPMFQAALGQTSEQLKMNQAMSGNYGSGGMVNQLFQNYLAQGNDFINQQYNRLLSPIQMGYNATGMQQDYLTSGAAARAAGTVGAANARGAGAMNLLSTGTSLALASVTGGGSLLGNMFSPQSNVAAGLPSIGSQYPTPSYGQWGINTNQYGILP